ncbi:MAG: hemolysin III family protein [Clostridia bacterium]
MAFRDRNLPTYSLAEELISAISHGVGALLSIAGLVVGVVFAVMSEDVYAVVSMAIFGGTLVLLYTMSTIYHALKKNNAKRVFQVIDHCSIFLLIAGTYTPFTLVAIRNTAWGWPLFGIVWAAAIVGIVLNAISIEKFKKFSMICYIAMGWVIVFAIMPLYHSMQLGGIILVLTGGIFYTVGAVLYGLGKKKKYMHSLWHFFVLVGSLTHYFAILFYVIIK